MRWDKKYLILIFLLKDQSNQQTSLEKIQHVSMHAAVWLAEEIMIFFIIERILRMILKVF